MLYKRLLFLLLPLLLSCWWKTPRVFWGVPFSFSLGHSLHDSIPLSPAWPVSAIVTWRSEGQVLCVTHSNQQGRAFRFNGIVWERHGFSSTGHQLVRKRAENEAYYKEQSQERALERVLVTACDVLDQTLPDTHAFFFNTRLSISFFLRWAQVGLNRGSLTAHLIIFIKSFIETFVPFLKLFMEIQAISGQTWMRNH